MTPQEQQRATDEIRTLASDPEWQAARNAEREPIQRVDPDPDVPGSERMRRMREYLKEKWRGVPRLVYIQITEPREKIKSMARLKAARKKVLKLAETVRDEAFDYWLREYVKPAERPDEWTQSRTLYENYLKRAKEYGNNRGDKRLSKEELATETQWGKMMGSLYQKKRRTAGNYYPVRLKRGA